VPASARTTLASALLTVGVVFVALAWWFLEQSACAGNLKQGVGDIEAASALEGQALISHLVGALLLAFGISVAWSKSSNWLQAAAFLAFFPLTYAVFLGMSLAQAGIGKCG
jgi:hypothetical protein